VQGLFCPKLPGFPKSIALYEGSHTSTVCPSYRSSIKMQVVMEQWWNDTYLTWTGTGSNAGLPGERPVTV